MSTYTICISSVIVHRVYDLNHFRCCLCVSSFGPAENLGQRGTAWAVAPVLRIATTLIAVNNEVFPERMVTKILLT
ncbi:MAG: hypothetical protein CM15mV41_0360 [Caudoviricetes sp.]|nr:MAG: hypothetical protein CM15mV41_0360 [Caudoviricetes sp.]